MVGERNQREARASTTEHHRHDDELEFERAPETAKHAADVAMVEHLSPHAQKKTAQASDASSKNESSDTMHAAAAQGIATPARPLPHSERIQASFGAEHDVSNIQAHIDPASTRALGAEAYAVGNHVVFASEPSVDVAAHEAAHVVQQAQGVSLERGVGDAGDQHELRADDVGDRVKEGKSATDLLGPAAKVDTRNKSALQKKKATRENDGDKSASDDSTKEQLVGDLLQAIDQSARSGLGFLAVDRGVGGHHQSRRRAPATATP